MEQLQELLGELKQPPEEFTPIPFWFLNDAPNEERIRAQLIDYTKKGVNAIVLHPRIGLPKELTYLSNDYFKIIRFIVKTAAELKMKIVLYDEGMYPSGSAHGQVVETDAAFASKGITLTEQIEAEKVGTENGDAVVLCKMSDGHFLVYGDTGGTIRGIHFGEDDGEPGAPKSADILNPKAVECFIHLTHDRYYEELKQYFGTTIIGFFTDEPCALGRNAEGYFAWAAGMEQEIEQAGGKMEELQGLFSGEDNNTTKLYRKLVKKHLRETFYKPLSQWCENHGIALMGHPAESDDIEEELYFHIPGQDLIMRRVAPETGGLTEFDSVQAKLTADIAKHLGCRRNANECFGVCCREQIPWYFTGRDMKWYINWLGMRGVNLFVPHAFYYSVAGERKGERPPDVGPNNIWWEHYKLFSDYMKRISYLMTDTQNEAHVAVLCDNNRVPGKEIACLYENQIAFDYLPIGLLKECRQDNGRLCIRSQQYEVVLNVYGTEFEEKLKEQFKKEPGQEAGKNAGELCGIKIIQSAEEVTEQGIRRTVYTANLCRQLTAAHLKKNGSSMYLLSNEGEEDISTQVTLLEQASVLKMDLWTGNVVQLEAETVTEAATGATKVNLFLAACEMCLLIAADKNTLLPEENSRQEGQAENWTKKFKLIEQGKNHAAYCYTFEQTMKGACQSFFVDGEEMAECYCNGRFVGVSFYGPHHFEIGAYAAAGKNEIRLVMTGNAANIYGNAKIWYGLKQ